MVGLIAMAIWPTTILTIAQDPRKCRDRQNGARLAGKDEHPLPGIRNTSLIYNRKVLFAFVTLSLNCRVFESPVLLRIIATAFLIFIHTSAAAENIPAGEGISEKIPKLVEEYSRLSGIFVPELQSADIEILLAGKSVISASREPGREQAGDVEEMGLLGIQLVEAPRLLVWLSLLGGSGQSDDRVVTAMLSQGPGSAYSRYQYVNLPWPIRDRHWVIFCEKNVALADATDGVIWEHRWSLQENGEQLLQTAFDDGRIPRLNVRTFNKTVYLPANRGTWGLIELGQNKTLIVAFYDADLGGRLPGGLVRSFTKRQLRRYLEATREQTDYVLQFYDENYPVHDGFGSPISWQDASDVFRNRENGHD
jgi:hypothetical protein